MAEFEITQGDFGVCYTGKIEGVDMSAYTAKVYVWNSKNTVIINGATCAVIFVTPDTHVEYLPIATDFETVPVGTYNAIFVLTKTDAKEHVKPFTIRVLAKPPGT